MARIKRLSLRGYRQQDVMEWIDNSSIQHEQAMEQLTSQLKLLQTENESLHQELIEQKNSEYIEFEQKLASIFVNQHLEHTKKIYEYLQEFNHSIESENDKILKDQKKLNEIINSMREKLYTIDDMIEKSN